MERVGSWDGQRAAGRSEPQREPDVQEEALFGTTDGEHVADTLSKASGYTTLALSHPPTSSFIETDAVATPMGREKRVMSILSNPSAVAPQAQHEFSISPLHSSLEASNPISSSCSQRSEPIKTPDSLPSSQSYCPPTYSTTSYSMDPVTAGYQYSQYGQTAVDYLAKNVSLSTQRRMKLGEHSAVLGLLQVETGQAY
ncbi:hypothetical protein DNTS_009167 [Danionella cerebrum]|uniref:OAR domain-containing protein n=1 Tax=Danionella cerebrum TaxID=2873325 RepID=A0A553QAZ2_9TELE|nr:hypothetical protein DNTS_009167 [Danionella translucida]